MSTPGYNRIFATDFNKDSKTDLLFYADKGQNVTVHFSEKDMSFSKPLEKFFFYPVNDINKFNVRYGNQTYILISRSRRIASLVSFTDYGTVQVLNNHEFDSYPSFLAVGDLDNDGRKEAVVSGSNFDGISILREEDLVLKEEKLVINKIYKSVRLADLDYDGYPDISAYDLLNNSIVFFINNQVGSFFEGKSVNISSSLIDYTFADLKSDGFLDLIAYSKNTLTVFAGDSISSFAEITDVPVAYTIKKVKVSDLNDDKIPEIIFMTDDKIIINYAAKEDSLNKYTVTYGFNSLLNDFEILGTKNKRILILSNQGVFYQIRRLEEFAQDFTLPIGGNLFHYRAKSGNKKYENFSFLVPEKKKITILNNLNRYYNINLKSNFEHSLQIENQYGHQNVLYAKGENNLQFLRFDKEFKLIDIKSIYSGHPVIDIYFNTRRQDGENLSLLTGKDGMIGIQNISLKDHSFAGKYAEIPDSNIIAAGFFDNNTMDYWKVNENGIIHVNYKPEENIFSSNIFADLPDSTDGNPDFYAVCLNRQKRKFIAVMKSSSDTRLYYLDSRGVSRMLVNNTLIDFGEIESPDQFRVLDTTPKEAIYYNDKAANKLYKLTIDPVGNKLNGSVVIESFDVNYYLIMRIEERIFLTYSDKSYNYCEFHEIK